MQGSTSKNRTVSLCELPQLLGFLESTWPAVWLAPLHFRHLQYCLIQQLALNKGSYDNLVSLQLLAKSELQWWISNIHRVNGSLIHPPSCEMTITSDASKLGWGAACGLQTTKGSWSSQERSFHINILELKAAFLAIQSFLKHKANISIKLRLDNTTAVYYINNKGGTRSPELMALTMGVVDVVSQQKYLHSSRASARSTELPASTPETLKNPIDPTMTHPMFPRLHLAVWLVSSDRARQSAFRNTLPDLSQLLFANPLTRPTIHYGENGIAGVIDGKLIQFQQVEITF